MCANYPKWCDLFFGGLICLALGAVPLAQAAPVGQPLTAAQSPGTAADRGGGTNRLGDIVYVLYYRENPKEPWFEWLVYTDLEGAQKDAKKFEDAGVETKILKRPAK